MFPYSFISFQSNTDSIKYFVNLAVNKVMNKNSPVKIVDFLRILKISHRHPFETCYIYF